MMPKAPDVMKSEMAEIESSNTKKAQSVAAPRGGVMVRFERMPEGRLCALNLQGSEAAVEAARTAIVN
jgi:hypothetical protein